LYIVSIETIFLSYSVLGGFNNSIECVWVSNGDFAEQFSVELNIGLFTAVDELAVSYTSLSAGCT
jgi:hypothetical protein